MHESTKLPIEWWWIGLSKIWMWSDQSQFSYHNWDDTTEDGTYPICTAVGSSGKWEKEKCSEKKPFYCYDDDLILHWVKRRAQQASTDHVWLGLLFSCISKSWYWVNEDRVCYQNWASQNLQDDCGHMGAIESRGGQKWHKLPKTERLNFICSKRVKAKGPRTNP
ncbi:hypothetical protein GJAV_G00090960 [Gymnothorax javanicus]|nr:hypothetical protein GJAV_G00090960 [Gymnothorax javanicus]